MRLPNLATRRPLTTLRLLSVTFRPVNRGMELKAGELINEVRRGCLGQPTGKRRFLPGEAGGNEGMSCNEEKNDPSLDVDKELGDFPTSRGVRRR